MDDC